MSTFKTVFTALFPAAFLAACSTVPTGPADADFIRFAYQAAISDAAVVSPGKISPLLAVPAGPNIRVVSWVSEKRIPCAGKSLPCDLTLGDDPLWVTLSGEVQSICRSWKLQGDALRRRLEQLLGMPMDPAAQYRKAAFVDFDVARENLERPCLGVDSTTSGKPTCTLDAQPTTPSSLRDFVGRQMAESYVVDSSKGPGYPFTRLGYTYDWAPAADSGHYGASEFIIMPMSGARAIAVILTDDYCRMP
jgi:hypothetical protein